MMVRISRYARAGDHKSIKDLRDHIFYVCHSLLHVYSYHSTASVRLIYECMSRQTRTSVYMRSSLHISFHQSLYKIPSCVLTAVHITTVLY